MKYALVAPCDQTIAYFVGIEQGETVSHPEATLFDTKEEAQATIVKIEQESPQGLADADWYSIEEVKDVAEFRAREDTW